jgi:hypothetical protein
MERAISTARPGNVQGEVSAAWTNGVFFVVWEEFSPTGGAQVYGTRVRPDGTVLDRGGILLSTRPDDNNVHPRVAGGAGRFLVVWQIDIEGTFSDLGAAMVTTGGRVTKQWGLSFVDNGQTAPDVAWNGRLFLATWQDEPDPDDEDIYGARVTSDGLTLDGCSSDSCPNGDAPGIPIALGPGDQVRPVVTGTSDMFLVSWTDMTDVSDPSDATVRDTAVAVNGLSLDTTGFDLTAGAGTQTDPAVAWNGATALFAWTNRAGTASDIHATTMEPGDEQNYFPVPDQPNGFAVSAAAGDQTTPAVAKRRGSFVAAWTDARAGNRDVYAARVGITGSVLDPAGVRIATGARQQHDPSLASSGPTVLVAYARDVPAAPFGGRDRVYLRIVT